CGLFAHAVLHELHFLPFHQLAFGIVGAAFGLAGLLRNVVQRVLGNRSAQGRSGFLLVRVWLPGWRDRRLPLRPRRRRLTVRDLSHTEGDTVFVALRGIAQHVFQDAMDDE